MTNTNVKIKAYLIADPDNEIISLVWDEAPYLFIPYKDDQDFFEQLQIAQDLPGVLRMEVIYGDSSGDGRSESEK